MSLNEICNPNLVRGNALNVTFNNVNCNTVNGGTLPPSNQVLFQNPASSEVVGDVPVYDTVQNRMVDSGLNVSLHNINCATKSLQNVTNLNGVPVSSIPNVFGSVISGELAYFNGSGNTIVGTPVTTDGSGNLQVPAVLTTNSVNAEIPSTGSLTFNGSGEAQVNWNGGYLMKFQSGNINSYVPLNCQTIHNSTLTNTHINDVCSSNIYKYTVPCADYPTIQSCVDDLYTQFLISGLSYPIRLLPGTYADPVSMKLGCSGICGVSQTDCIITNQITVSGISNYSFSNFTVSITSNNCFQVNFLPVGTTPISVKIENVSMIDNTGGLNCIAQLSNTQTYLNNCKFYPNVSNNTYLVGATNGAISMNSCQTFSNQGIISASYCLLAIKNSILGCVLQLGDQSYGGTDSTTLLNFLDQPTIVTSGASPPGNFFVMNNLICVAPNATTDHYLVNTQSGGPDHTYAIFYNTGDVNCIPGTSGRYWISGSNLLLTTMTQMVPAP